MKPSGGRETCYYTKFRLPHVSLLMPSSPAPSLDPADKTHRMTPEELRATLSLAALFMLRMLGLFFILPVFSVHARGMPGAGNQTLVGIALGAYGLTQAMLQIPFGMASDRYGRKRTIAAGLAIFAIGSFVAAAGAASHIWVVILGRVLQGAGAISAAVIALAADLTREQHRTKAMAVIGGSVGITFAVSLVAAPSLYHVIGMSGIFLFTGILSLAGIWATFSVVPGEPAALDESRRVEAARLRAVLADRQLLRLNMGIFSLHTLQMAMFVVVPVALVHSGLELSRHWQIYLPVVLASFILMLPPVFIAERRGRMKAIFVSAIVLLVLAQIGFALWGHGVWPIAGLMVLFFLAFNVLEAALPSLITRVAPSGARGTAIGVYNTTQSLGLFVGGLCGGLISQHYGSSAVFVFGAALAALWLLVAWGMRAPGDVLTRRFALKAAGDPAALRERLMRLRGVRDAVLMPEQGAALVTFYSERWDEQAAVDLLEGRA